MRSIALGSLLSLVSMLVAGCTSVPPRGRLEWIVVPTKWTETAVPFARGKATATPTGWRMTLFDDRPLAGFSGQPGSYVTRTLTLDIVTGERFWPLRLEVRGGRSTRIYRATETTFFSLHESADRIEGEVHATLGESINGVEYEGGTATLTFHVPIE